MSIRVNAVQRRVFALLFDRGEARVEDGRFIIDDRMELPGSIIRQLIRMGLVSVFRSGKKVHIRPSIGAAGQMEQAREVDTAPRRRAA